MQRYPIPQGDSVEPIVREIGKLRERARTAERPGGTSLASLVAQVQAALVNITATVIDAANTFLAGGFTTGNIISTGNITAAGQVSSTQPVKSAGSYSYVAGANRRTQWIDDTFQMGQTTSSRRYKHDFERMSDEDVVAFLSLQPRWGRYNWSPEDSPREAFLLAEDVAALDVFGQDVLVRDAEGRPDGINYSQLAAPLLAICRAQQQQIHELSTRLAALDNGVVIPAPTDLPSAADQPVDDPVMDPNPPKA